MTQGPVSRLHLRALSRLSIGAVVLSVAVAALVVAPAALARTARAHRFSGVTSNTAREPKFSGSAPGSVSCSVSAKVSFSPPLTKSGGGTGSSAVKATLSRCTTSSSAVTVTSAKATGSFATSPLSCVSGSTTAASASLTITWKGRLNGTVGGRTYTGPARFSSTSVSVGTSNGSFAGDSAFTVNVPSNLAALCGRRRGVKNASVAGTLTVGTSTGGSQGATLWAWGENNVGQLGDGTTNNNSTPEHIGTDTDWAQVSAEFEHTAAIKTNGTLWAWGDNSTYELGDGTTNNESTPEQIGTDTNWAQVSAGAYYTVAIKTDGTLWAWGDNGDGQLGDGTTISESSPEQIGTDTDWKQVSAGYNNFSTVAVKTNGTLWAWGDNSIGELGDGTDVGPDTCPTNDPCSTVPIQIGTDTDWAQVSAGTSHTVAVKTDGTLWAWGENNVGQLGDGTTTQQDSPEQIGTDTDWAQVSAGAYYTMAIKTDGTLWAWGYNAFGQLGDGTTNNASRPEQIGTDTNWAQASAGQYQTVALKSDHTLWAWGDNSDGQLGDGTLISESSPEQIGTDTDWAQVSAGYDFTMAIGDANLS